MVATLKPTNDLRSPWLVKYEGKIIRLTTDDLMNFKRFSTICMEQLRFLPPQVRKDTWRNIIVDQVNKVKDTPPELEDVHEVSDSSRFVYYLNRFCANHPAKTLDEMKFRKPMRRGNFYIFRYEDFQRYLNANGIKNMMPREITAALRQLGGDNEERVSIDKKQVRVWRVPAKDSDMAIALDSVPLNYRVTIE